MQRARAFSNAYVFAGVLVALACLRIGFAGVLLSDEDYHMAAAIQILHGKIPYRDFWYDKPPLPAVFYLVAGGFPGIVLRLWDAAYILFCCFLAHKLARAWWGEAEGRVAALSLAFFTTFYLPSSAIPFAPDALLIAPHFAAIFFARQGRAWLAGLMCGLGFWTNVKAVFVAAACAAWLLPSLLALAGGIAMALALGAALLAALGMAPGYWEQVWVWGVAYARGSPVPHPLLLAIERVAHWLGFHAALALGWVAGACREKRTDQLKLLIWLAASFAAVCFGNHFAPRYFLQMLPPLVVAGARGIVWAFETRRTMTAIALCTLLSVPCVRFAPRYFKMSRDPHWPDIAMDLDSRQAAARINALSHRGDTLFVWGYRPDIFVYTRLAVAGKFWDSQPLTGVAADRHLEAKEPAIDSLTADHLTVAEQLRPTFFVDGLRLLNPNLGPQKFPHMHALLTGYREVARTNLSVIYQRNE